MNRVDLIIYPVSDVAKATKFYTTLLGTEPYADSPYYVGFKAGETEIGLVPKTPGMNGALAYVNVDDIDAAMRALLAAGAEKLQDPTDVAQGLLVASVKNLDGTAIGLRQFPKS
ncbi:MAG TPA: VOC family protein [Candidatus Baltobacteraceae bacterium]|nr:VOC family protein [Candidatus Baltobacteraceae bacterium]